MLSKKLERENKMDLAISIGNSNIQVATTFEQKLQTWKIPVDTKDLPLEFAKIFSQLTVAVNHSILASVNPNLTTIIQNIVQQYCHVKPIITTLESGLILDYSSYQGLGIDRAICCEGAYLLQQPPFIMIDLGTATTINVVDNERRFIGGMILPGVQMGLAALANNTALLPSTDLQPVSPQLLGQTTKTALLSGAINGNALLLDNAIERIWTTLDLQGPTIITGGNAPIIIPAMQTKCDYKENLIIEGLFAILNRNNEVS